MTCQCCRSSASETLAATLSDAEIRRMRDDATFLGEDDTVAYCDRALGDRAMMVCSFEAIGSPSASEAREYLTRLAQASLDASDPSAA